jgi:glycosyltransferase involved in cell wall biosynthesis
MFEVMACARPIVLGIEGQAREILDAAQAGIAVPPEDVDAYAEAILRLAHDPDLRHRYGASGREYVVQHYSRSVKAEEFVGYLMQVQGKSAESIKDVYKA